MDCHNAMWQKLKVIKVFECNSNQPGQELTELSQTVDEIFVSTTFKRKIFLICNFIYLCLCLFVDQLRPPHHFDLSVLFFSPNATDTQCYCNIFFNIIVSSRWDKKYILHGTHFHAPGFEATWALSMHQEKKNPMVIFFIFVHKNLYRIRFQEIKIGPWEDFEKKAFFSLFLMRKRLSSGQKWFLRL